MGRYDRIARLDCPNRDATFPGWLTLRDLDGREREPELGRRARLRFLALRPVRRLLARGLDGSAAESIDRQVHAVRNELERLPDTDPERTRLSDYLEEIGGRTPAGIVRATLEVGAAAEFDGHRFAAEEFYHTALELATAHGLIGNKLQALSNLGRLHRDAGEWDAAETWYRAAAAEADGAGDDNLLPWARALGDLAMLLQRRQEATAARAVLADVRERGEANGSVGVVALAAAARCALELAERNMEAALAAGWRAVHLLQPEDEERNRVLLNMGSAFRHLDLPEAAESAYRVVERWSGWPESRTEAHLELAVTAAERGDAAAFGPRKAMLLESLDRDDPRMSALSGLGLGRACILLGEHEAARDHLREAIATARDNDLVEILDQAEDLLTRLESGTATSDSPASRPSGSRGRAAGSSTETHQVAERVVRLERELVSAG